jgi:hypothetical protein
MERRFRYLDYPGDPWWRRVWTWLDNAVETIRERTGA